MAEFSELVRVKKRLCAEYRGFCCKGCPINESNNDLCGIISISGYSDVKFYELEDVLLNWAAEHPEPVYPTWLEWLQEMGVMTDIHDRLNNYKQVMEVCGKPLYSIPTTKVFCHIPADIAEKLGIEPKEGI